MRDLEKCADQGLKRLCKAPAYYLLSQDEMKLLYDKALCGGQGRFEAIVTAFNAGIELGARMIENGNKQRKKPLE